MNWSAGTLALVPALDVTVTATGPVAAAAGETAVIEVGELTTKLFAAVLPKLTRLALRRSEVMSDSLT